MKCRMKRFQILVLLISSALVSSVLIGQAKAADVAYNNGYQAGFKLGQSDKKLGDKQDFTLASAYRRATDGWKEGSGGELESYRTNYRAGFADGYKDGLGGQMPAHSGAAVNPI